MWYYLSFLLIFQMSNCEDSIKNETVLEGNSEGKNKSEPEPNNTFEYERITKPLIQDQQIERALINPQATNFSIQKAKSDFRPSPHLETYLEYNKFPVPPALPEAKHFSVYNNFEQPSAVHWPDNSYTTEQSWTSRIKFPTTSTATPVPTAKDRPYQFYNNDKYDKEKVTFTGKSYSVPMASDPYLQKPIEQLPTIEEWNAFLHHQKKKQLVQKHQFDFTAPVEAPAVYGASGGGDHKTTFEYGEIEKPPQEIQPKANPWKKIIKFLTAAIPIGLLITALTPTVITVQSVNGTQFRSRAVDSASHSPNKKLISSLNYFNSVGCEDRILCELVLSASATQDAEQHVENLLNTFTQEGKAVEKAEEMRKILEAVKMQDCRSIICEDMKEKT